MPEVTISDQQREEFYRLFPKLRVTEHKFTSIEDTSYNCVAWAAGDNVTWWDPDPRYQKYYYWPIELRIGPLEPYLQAFYHLGYEVCENDFLKEGFEKIAIYTKEQAFKHATRQLSSGMWTSKCGETFDLIHVIDALTNDDYGIVTIIMKRPCN